MKGKYLLPKRTVRLRYTLTVEPNAVADGETLKVWLPFPRKNIERQTDVKLLSTTQERTPYRTTVPSIQVCIWNNRQRKINRPSSVSRPK